MIKPDHTLNCNHYWTPPVYAGDGDTFTANCRLALNHVGMHYDGSSGQVIIWENNSENDFVMTGLARPQTSMQT
jgi:hypothetical protein